MNYYKGLALFAGGVLFGSAGIKLLSSKDAKKVYIHATAAGLRMKDCVMETATHVQENADIFSPVQRTLTKPEWRRKKKSWRTLRKPPPLQRHDSVGVHRQIGTEQRGPRPSLFPY